VYIIAFIWGFYCDLVTKTGIILIFIIIYCHNEKATAWVAFGYVSKYAIVVDGTKGILEISHY